MRVGPTTRPLSDTRCDMTHHPARHPLPTPCIASRQSASLAAVDAGSSEDVTIDLACVETLQKNVSSDASRQELKDQDGLNADYHRYKLTPRPEHGRCSCLDSGTYLYMFFQIRFQTSARRLIRSDLSDGIGRIQIRPHILDLVRTEVYVYSGSAWGEE